MSRPPTVAIAHDYLTQRGGAEKVVLALARAFPESPIYTTLYEPEDTYPEFSDLDIRTSPLNRINFFRKNHRAALPLLPFVASSMKIDADVVISSSSGWAHGFRTNGKKLVYCYSPARWLYQQDAYLGKDASLIMRAVLSGLSRPLKAWDRNSAKSAAQYLAISTVVKQRIAEAYGLDSTVLSAPYSIDVSLPLESVDSLGDWADDKDNRFYLCISRLLPYKNVDKVVAAFRDTDRRLVVVGAGPQEEVLQRAKSDNVRMVKELSDGQIRWLYSHCRGLIAASFEDFGLTPLEASCYGKPSAVLRWGGFLDTITEGVTGVYFDEPIPAQIAAALDDLESREWSAHQMSAAIQRFTEETFVQTLMSQVLQVSATSAGLVCGSDEGRL